MVHMESFPYRLADNKWHKIAVSISGTEIQLIIDCHPLYKRVMHSVRDRNFSASNMQLLVGQRNLNGHSLFKVNTNYVFFNIIIVSKVVQYRCTIRYMSCKKNKNTKNLINFET